MRSVCLARESLAALLESVCRVPVWQRLGRARRREAGGNWPGTAVDSRSWLAWDVCRSHSAVVVSSFRPERRGCEMARQAGSGGQLGRASQCKKQTARSTKKRAGRGQCAVQCSADTEDEALALALAIDPVSEGRWRRRGGERGGRTQEVGMGCGAVVQRCSSAAVQLSFGRGIRTGGRGEERRAASLGRAAGCGSGCLA